MPKTQSKPLNKIKVLGINTDFSATPERKAARVYGGVAYYRLLKPMENLEGIDFTFKSAEMLDESVGKTTAEFYSELVKGQDIIVTKCIDNPEAASALLFFANRYGVKLVLDLDDNLFEVKSDQPAYELYKRGGEKRPIVSALVSMADALFVSTQPLKDYYEKYLLDAFKKKTPIFVLPNYNDVKDFNFPLPEKNKDKIVLGWIGSTTHMDDLRIVLPAIERLLREYPNLEFNIVGGLNNEMALELFKDSDETITNRIFFSGGTLGWVGFPKMLMELNWDIGLAPLTDHEFNRCKSHIKWMEMAMKHIPTVASKCYPYWMPILGQDTIIDWKTGVLCDDKEWYYKLRKLIENKELREKIGENAYKYVSENLQYDKHRFLWKNALLAVQKIKVKKTNML